MSSKDDLLARQCKPCEGGVPPLEKDAARQLLEALDENAHAIGSVGDRPGLAWIANMEGHHPDLEVGYSKCVVNYTTHAIDGLSENDFICAAKIDRLLA